MRSLALLIATWLTLTLALLGLVLLAHLASAAPAPMRPALPVRPLERRELVGSWRVSWSYAAGWRIDLAADGTYRAVGSYGGVWVGAWGVEQGELWIQERPASAPDADPLLFFFALTRVPREKGGGFAGTSTADSAWSGFPLRLRR